MKQVLQSLKTGGVEVAQIPVPGIQSRHLLVRTDRTLISAGTERMLVDFGKAGFIGKARQQPEKVRQVLDKMRTDGVMPTLEAVFNKLDQPLPMGYCNVGRVQEVGSGVVGFDKGQRVVSNGKHAEVVCVPVNLCAAIPDSVSDDEAVFTVIGAIGLQGVRLAQPALGETVVVMGLGLVGLLTVQLLQAHGCRVLGCDFDPARLELARRFGAQVVNLGAGEDVVAAATAFSRGRGADAVLITASTSSNEPVHQAALMCRKRGRIVLVGVAGLELSRADFFEKELTFQVSCSYGPGRYDPSYEERGVDYPVGFVRWTEQRNFEAVLDMMADRRIDVRPLITHRFEIGAAENAYELVSGGEPSLGILLDYAASAPFEGERTVQVSPSAPAAGKSSGGVSVIGSGNYATGVLIPAFHRAGARLRTVASRAGVTGLHAARKFKFEQTTTDLEQIFADPQTSAVVIATQHDTHAALTARALAAGKHVFVEKPLALDPADLPKLAAALQAAPGTATPIVTVGFNRRFAPHVVVMKKLLSGIQEPKSFVMTVNAGAIPSNHWTQGPAGGGRIVGEACHFIDLLRFLAGVPIRVARIARMDTATRDTATITLEFVDGSLGAIHYLANGSKAFPKERVEVFARGGVLQLDNFRQLRGFGWPGFRKMKLWRQDKGQRDCARAFLAAVETGVPPIPLDELFEVARISIELGA